MEHPSSRKRLAFIGVLVLVPCALGVIGAELYVRVSSPYGYVTPGILRHRALEYVPSLFARHVFPLAEQEVLDERGALRYSVNAQGYRGGAFQVLKPPGVTRVMVYGGSSVFDIEATEGSDWPHLLQLKLRQAGLTGVEVINAGIPGHATFDSVGRLFSEGHLYSPDVVLLYSAWNDIKDFRETGPLLRYRLPLVLAGDPRTTYQNVLDRWISESSQLYVRLRERYYAWRYDIGSEGAVPKGIMTASISEAALRQYRMSVRTFVDVARNAGALPILVSEARLVARGNSAEERGRIHYEFVLLTHEALCDAYEATDRILREVSEEKNVPFIDASGRLTGRDELFVDHVHLNGKGSDALSTFMAQSMTPLLAARSATAPLPSLPKPH